MTAEFVNNYMGQLPGMMARASQFVPQQYQQQLQQVAAGVGTAVSLVQGGFDVNKLAALGLDSSKLSALGLDPAKIASMAPAQLQSMLNIDAGTTCVVFYRGPVLALSIPFCVQPKFSSLFRPLPPSIRPNSLVC